MNIDFNVPIAKWFDPECLHGCQSLIYKDEINKLRYKITSHYCIHHNDKEREESYKKCPVCLANELAVVQEVLKVSRVQLSSANVQIMKLQEALEACEPKTETAWYLKVAALKPYAGNE